MSDALAGLRLATGTLTMVPVGDLPQPTRHTAAWAMSLGGVAALPLAAVAAFTGWLGDLARLPALVTAALVLAALGLGSRAMHLDGLADTADGIGAGWSRERALEVMRQGDVGPMGVAAVVLVLLVQASAAAAVLTHGWGWLVVAVAVVVSRSSCALTCVRGVGPARSGGMGAVVAGTVPPMVAGLVLAVAAGVLAGVTTLAGPGPWPGIAAVALMCLVVALLLRTTVRLLGGVTGDVMGACIELSLAALLVALSAGVGW